MAKRVNNLLLMVDEAFGDLGAVIIDLYSCFLLGFWVKP